MNIDVFSIFVLGIMCISFDVCISLGIIEHGFKLTTF